MKKFRKILVSLVSNNNNNKSRNKVGYFPRIRKFLRYSLCIQLSLLQEILEETSRN